MLRGKGSVEIYIYIFGWLCVCILWHIINLCRLFNTKSIFIQINSSISNNTVSMSRKVPFETIQLSISTQFSSICFIDRTLSGWTWEWWQWKGTPHSPKLLHYWNLTIRLFGVISRILVGEVLPLCREAVNVLHTPPQPTGS